MADFERLRGMALTGADGRVALRYVRERESRREARASSRAMQMSELAAAAREKHRGLFARLAREA